MLGVAWFTLKTKDPAEQRLMNVVEEMAIASGVTMPEVYVLKGRSINAFAAGSNLRSRHRSDDRACTYSPGDELQAVMAHEFSHILNGDMRLNIPLYGLLNGILGLAIIGRILLEFTSREEKNPLPLPRSAIAHSGGCWLFLASGSRVLFPDSGNTWQMSAVQFTRNPEAMTGARKN